MPNGRSVRCSEKSRACARLLPCFGEIWMRTNRGPSGSHLLGRSRIDRGQCCVKSDGAVVGKRLGGPLGAQRQRRSVLVLVEDCFSSRARHSTDISVAGIAGWTGYMFDMVRREQRVV